MDDLEDYIGQRISCQAIFYGEEYGKTGILKEINKDSIKIDNIELPFFGRCSAIKSLSYRDDEFYSNPYVDKTYSKMEFISEEEIQKIKQKSTNF